MKNSLVVRWVGGISIVAMLGLGFVAQAGELLVTGSPEYDLVTRIGMAHVWPPADGAQVVNNSGVAVGFANKFIGTVPGTGLGYRGIRWNASGTISTELGNLGTDSNGVTSSIALAVNASGTAVGYAHKYVNGDSVGFRAVRWDASGTVATELGNLGTNTSGNTEVLALGINNVGTVVGSAAKFVNGVGVGRRAVRWDASGTVATELGNLGTSNENIAHAQARVINDAGTAAGWAEKYVNGIYQGERAVRWDASGTVATELGSLGTASNGLTIATALAVNASGTVVGRATKYVNGVGFGERAVRWDASGAVATELGNLGTASNGVTTASALAVNASGTAVGYAHKYVNGVGFGERAVRWDASGTVATELGILGSDRPQWSHATGVNTAGTAVGSIQGSDGMRNAVVWLPNAMAINLNNLGVIPTSGTGCWVLTEADSISADGWVAGRGRFTPIKDGVSNSYYVRGWVAQVGLGGSWTEAAGGTWGRGANWSTGTPAMQIGNASFNLKSIYTVELDRDERTQTIAVNAGMVTLDLNGHTLTTENGLSIAKGATLKAAGTIASDIINAGLLTPEGGRGTLDVIGTLTNANALEFEIAGGACYDKIHLSDVFNAGGKVNVVLQGGYTPLNGDRFDLMDFRSLNNQGYMFDFTRAGLSEGLRWDTRSFADTGCIGVVPEPGTVSLLITGAAAVWLFTRRRHGRS